MSEKVKEKSGISCLHIIALGTEDHDIAEISGFHTCIEDTLAIGDDVQFHIELILQERRAPAQLQAGEIRQLAVDVQPDNRLLRGALRQ